MRKVLLKTTLLPLAMLFGAGTVAAASPAFDDLDINGDGMLSAEETAAVKDLNLATADTDGDGALSREEFEAAGAKMPEGADGASGAEGSAHMEGSSTMGSSTMGSSTMESSTMGGTGQKSGTAYE